MSLSKATVAERPDLACIGSVQKVGEVKQSEGSKFHNFAIELKGHFGAPDSTYYFTFQPRWFSRGFDPTILAGEDKVLKAANAKAGLAFLYAKNIAYANAKKPGALEVLLGDNFAAVASAFDQMEPQEVTAETVVNILREVIVGAEAGYVLRQKKDEEGNLADQYQLYYFFPTAEGILNSFSEAAANPRRKTPMVVTWDEGEDLPF